MPASATPVWSRLLIGFLLCAVVAVAAACGGPGGPDLAPRSLRANDVPAGWTRCGWSGQVPAARSRQPAQTDAVRADWAAQKKHGATASVITTFVAAGTDCAAAFGHTSGASAASWTLLYGSSSQAHAGYQAGVLGFPTPDPDRIQDNLKVGAGNTGLGADSWILLQTLPSPPLYLAWWRAGDLVTFLVVADLPTTSANTIALRLNQRQGG